MLEPRSSTGDGGTHTYLGGTADLDLWWRVEVEDDETETDREYRLRIVRISGQRWDQQWDMFKVPVDTNPATHWFGTGEQGYAGYFTDVFLTEPEMQQVDAYLRCFAPWTLGKGLTDA
jgi:hypothetical protein